MADVEFFKKYTVSQLKAWLSALGLRTSGNKAELVLRLLEVPQQLRNNTESVTNTDEDDGENNETENEAEGNEDNDDENGAENDSNVDDGDEEDELEGENEIVADKNGEKKKNEAVAEKNKKKSAYDNKRMEKEIELLKREMELKKRENEMLKKENEYLKNDRQTSVERKGENIGQIKDLIGSFGGTGDSFEHFEKQLRNIRAAYELNDSSMRILISLKLKDKALRWFHSKDNIVTVVFDELMAEMKQIFDDRSSQVQQKRVFELKKWLQNETFQDYFQEKIILGNRLQMREGEIIEYILEGIPDERLISSAKLQCFTKKEQLLEAFKSIRHPAKAKVVTATPSTSRQWTANVSVRQTRCYNCNSIGHMANKCKKEIRKPGACHVCAEMGHFAAQCPKRKKVPAIGYVNSDSEDEYIHS
ncbi:uncharacterized protein LOC129952793 isoform X2 [Eupeodes corollae]|uniref:uncharacterized protein LOC129952793 isoform X2 n=1 Tax=Eupeodes corollae TaxID=290404 RepID=UPI002491DC2B|nr:uncharacterized protein LOC129952793 isoform X2 [Eupeodes corollae]